MLDIKKVDHIGIRVSNKVRSIEFYSLIGFKLERDVGFDEGHPVIMIHRSGVTINLLGPSNAGEGENILMDNPEHKYTGITHVALQVHSMDEAKEFLHNNDIKITGNFVFNNMHAIFIRDPDRNVIELDAYLGSGPINLLSSVAY